jgi:hypothetical protein
MHFMSGPVRKAKHKCPHSLHPEIYSRCRRLYAGGDYGEAVGALTNYETGSEAFGKGKLYMAGAAASHFDDGFQNGVRFLDFLEVLISLKRSATNLLAELDGHPMMETL